MRPEPAELASAAPHPVPVRGMPTTTRGDEVTTRGDEVSEQAPTYRFRMQRLDQRPNGYSMMRWDRAEPISVLASTQTEAIEKARAMSGVARESWQFRIESIDEEAP